MINAPVQRGFYLDNFQSSLGQNKLIYPSNLMPKTTSPADRVSDMLAAISTAADALFKHTTKAISVQEKANRATPLLSVLSDLRLRLRLRKPK